MNHSGGGDWIHHMCRQLGSLGLSATTLGGSHNARAHENPRAYNIEVTHDRRWRSNSTASCRKSEVGSQAALPLLQVIGQVGYMSPMVN